MALDISTRIIGWSLWENGNPVEVGYINLQKQTELDKKLDEALRQFTELDLKPNQIAAEAALQMFSGGGSSSITLNKLIAFNFALTYTLSRKWNIPMEYIPVITARSMAGIKIPRQPRDQKKDPDWAKKIVKMDIIKRYPLIYEWDKEKAGKYKSDYDICDSLVIGIAALKGVKSD